jgi:hypothetical protein
MPHRPNVGDMMHRSCIIAPRLPDAWCARVLREGAPREGEPRVGGREEMVEAGLYLHYKGNQYRVVGNATHSESEEPLVVYHREGDSRLWARPAAMWHETVDTPSGPTPRFRKLDEG